jgi:hypothetical protein
MKAPHDDVRWIVLLAHHRLLVLIAVIAGPRIVPTRDRRAIGALPRVSDVRTHLKSLERPVASELEEELRRRLAEIADVAVRTERSTARRAICCQEGIGRAGRLRG